MNQAWDLNKALSRTAWEKEALKSNLVFVHKNRTVGTLSLPVHITLEFLEQINQIFLLWLRTSVICFKFFYVSFSDLQLTIYHYRQTSFNEIMKALTFLYGETFLYMVLKNSWRFWTTSPARSCDVKETHKDVLDLHFQIKLFTSFHNVVKDDAILLHWQ